MNIALAKLVVNYPQQLPDILQQSIEQFEYEAKMALAVKLFELKRISSGMAAQLVGIDRVTFLLELHRYQVVVHDLTENELMSDIENA